MNDDYDGLNFFRGLMIAVPISLALWYLIYLLANYLTN